MRRQGHREWHPQWGAWGAWGVAALGFAVLAWSSWGGIAPVSAEGPETRTLVDALLSGVFVAGAAIAALVGWRRHAQSQSGWVVSIGALIAAQALLVTLPAIANPPPRMTAELTALLLIAVAGLGCELVALAHLRGAPHVIDDAFAVGLGMGCVAAGHLVLLIHQGAGVDGPMLAVIGVLALAQVAAAGLVLHRQVLPRLTTYLLVATVLAVLAGFGVIVSASQATVWDTLASLALAAVGVAWIAAAWSCSQHGIERAAARHQEELDHALLVEARTQRGRLHELRSTIAGLVNGSEMLAQADLSTEVRLRLWESVRRELGRMQRLLSDEAQPVAPIELDNALALILDLQRLKGRHVELHTSGDVVEARYDSLAEVVNILMDNAATHGGTDSSVVEVMRRDQDTVDITVTDFGRGIPGRERQRIFEWGMHCGDSPGEGIGLSLAQSLVAEDGGSLRLAEAEGTCSSFVISLPSPRRAADHHLTDEDGHVSWRRPG